MQAEYRKVMGSYPTGVGVVTTKVNDKMAGLTINSLASVSLDPTIILWSIDSEASTAPIFKSANKFALHILSDDQQEVCINFTKKDIDRFLDVDWDLSENSLPLIQDCLGVIECQVIKTMEMGDHSVIFGEALSINVNESKTPLLYHKRNFGKIPESFYAVK